MVRASERVVVHVLSTVESKKGGVVDFISRLPNRRNPEVAGLCMAWAWSVACGLFWLD